MPNPPTAPKIFFQGNLGHIVLLLVDVIGSIVISLCRCYLPNDEGPASPPQIFFPRTAPGKTVVVGSIVVVVILPADSYVYDRRINKTPRAAQHIPRYALELHVRRAAKIVTRTV